MKISEINPYIRYAQINTISAPNKLVCCYDCRLFYILEGMGSVVSENQTYSFCPDTVMLWRSGTVYRFNTVSDVKIISVNFDYTQKFHDIISPFSPAEAKYAIKNKILNTSEFEDYTQLNSPIIFFDTSDIRQNLLKIVLLHQRKNIFFGERCSCLLKDIIIDCLYPALNVRNKMDTILSFIENNYSKNISNRDIADIIHYHPYHLNRLMLQYTGYTLHKYLMNMRLEKSVSFLINTSYSIKEISDKCGFSNPNYFSLSFSAKFGLSPSEYRNANKNLI